MMAFKTLAHNAIGRYLTFTAMLSATGVYAQQVSDSISGKVHSIPNVTVNAHKPTSKITSGTQIQQFTQERLSDLGIQNVAEAVKRFAGATVKDYGGIGGMKTVSVRNMGAAHTGVSYDGVPVSDAQSGFVDIGRFSLDNLSAITFSIGENDARLQTAKMYASAGVLQLETRRPTFDKKNHRMALKMKLASFGTYNPSVNYAHRFNDKTSVAADFNYLTSEGNYPFTLVNGKYTSREIRYNSGIRSFHTEWNLFHTFNEKEQLDAKAYYYDAKRGLPGAVSLYTQNEKETMWDKAGFVQMKYTNLISPEWEMMLVGKFDISLNRYEAESTNYTNGKNTDKYLQREYYLSGAIRYVPNKSFNIGMAQDVSANTLDSDEKDFKYPVRLTSLTALNAQYLWQRVKATATLINTWKREWVKVGEAPQDLKQLSPSVNINYQPIGNELLFVRAMYKHTFRVPTFTDLYYRNLGMTNLRPEIADEFGGGVAYSKNNWKKIKMLTLTADAYFNKVKDKIVAFPGVGIWRMRNYGSTHIVGLDLTTMLNYELSKRYTVDVQANYTYQSAIDVTDSKSKKYKNQLPYSPKHSGNVNVIFNTPYINVGYTLLAVDKRYFSDQNLPEYVLQGYMEHGISLSHTLSVKNLKLRTQLDVVNLTDQQYEIAKNYPMPGRSYKLTLKLSF